MKIYSTYQMYHLAHVSPSQNEVQDGVVTTDLPVII